MTAPCPETLEREKDKLYVTDAELMRKLGVDPKVLRPTIKGLDANPRSGFPRKDPLFGNRRYWPAVKEWFDAYNRIRIDGQGGQSHDRPRRTA